MELRLRIYRENIQHNDNNESFNNICKPPRGVSHLHFCNWDRICSSQSSWKKQLNFQHIT